MHTYRQGKWNKLFTLLYKVFNRWYHYLLLYFLCIISECAMILLQFRCYPQRMTCFLRVHIYSRIFISIINILPFIKAHLIMQRAEYSRQKYTKIYLVNPINWEFMFFLMFAIIKMLGWMSRYTYLCESASFFLQDKFLEVQ